VRLENESATLFADVAEIGASYLPGHGHADALSIEFSLFTHRLFINLGTSEYGKSARRDFERSTEAHSTLELNRVSSSEIWHGFRVGRRAKVSNVVVNSNEAKSEVAAQHNGYRYLSGKPIHTRSIILSKRELQIEDRVEKSNFLGIVRFHIHPSIKLSISRSGLNGLLMFPDGSEAIWEADADLVVEENNEYAWEFGLKIPMKTLALYQSESNRSALKVTW